MSSLRATAMCCVETAHADFDQTSQFVDALQPPKIVLVHGEKNTMRRLRDALRSKYRDNPGFEVGLTVSWPPIASAAHRVS